MVTPVAESFDFSFNGVEFKMYSAPKGYGLPKHDHSYPHLTFCVKGSIFIRKESIQLELKAGDRPVLLRQNEWHEIESLEDGSVFFNVFADGKH